MTGDSGPSSGADLPVLFTLDVFIEGLSFGADFRILFPLNVLALLPVGADFSKRFAFEALAPL